jgi:transposase-like protein
MGGLVFRGPSTGPNTNFQLGPVFGGKVKTTLPSIDDQVLSMYAKGMTTRDIKKHLESLYGIDASP